MSVRRVTGSATRWLVGSSAAAAVEWDVPTNYQLEVVVGSGSYGTVVRARDTARADLPVAIKRVANIEASGLAAKRALRELSILRRLGADAHGSRAVALYGAFVKPSPTGPYRFVGGEMVSSGRDLYTVTEMATGGDLLSLDTTLPPARVREVLKEILLAVRLLHSLHVWHRDIKSSNVLLSEGRVALCDFGLSRSARHAGGELGEEQDIHEYERLHAARRASGMGAAPSPGNAVAPLTSAVATPCYRAPECVISEGYYTGAMDVWGVGCIFAELLARQFSPGAKPLFTLPLGSAVPGSSEEYAFGGADGADEGGSKVARRHAELDAIFACIGTPSWATLESIRSQRWRHFLSRLAGRPGDLRRRFHEAGDLAVDLLERMLHFDPKSRPSAEEALSHAYFSDVSQHTFLPPLPKLCDDSLWGHDMGRPPELPKSPLREDKEAADGADATTAAASPAAKGAGAEEDDDAVARRMYSIRDPAEFLGELEALLEARPATGGASALVLRLIEAECEAISLEQRGWFFGRKPLWWDRAKAREKARGDMPPPPARKAAQTPPPVAKSAAAAVQKTSEDDSSGSPERNLSRHKADWSSGASAPCTSEAWRRRKGSASHQTSAGEDGGWVDGWPRAPLHEAAGAVSVARSESKGR